MEWLGIICMTSILVSICALFFVRHIYRLGFCICFA